MSAPFTISGDIDPGEDALEALMRWLRACPLPIVITRAEVAGHQLPANEIVTDAERMLAGEYVLDDD